MQRRLPGNLADLAPCPAKLLWYPDDDDVRECERSPVFPYLAMLAIPSSFALTGARRAGFLLLLVGLFYWLMIGFRFQVGADWNNYIFIFDVKKALPLPNLILGREPGYGALMWLTGRLGWNIIFINAVSALLFCWGMFSVARRCREPWLAVTIATPLLAVAFAMSGVRQALAGGVIFYLFATWEQRSTLGRAGLVALAMLFHFSAVFVLMFVALGSRAQPFIKFGGAAIIALLVLAIIKFAPDSMETYSRLYVGAEKMSAPGAVVQVGILAIAGGLYLINRQRWVEWIDDDPLIRNLAWGSLALLPVILISSVGAYRFALYSWPMAMYVYSGFPGLIPAATGRAFYRVALVIVSFAMMAGWLQYANNSLPWWPYRNWLLLSEPTPLISYKPYQR